MRRWFFLWEALWGSLIASLFGFGSIAFILFYASRPPLSSAQVAVNEAAGMIMGYAVPFFILLRMVQVRTHTLTPRWIVSFYMAVSAGYAAAGFVVPRMFYADNIEGVLLFFLVEPLALCAFGIVLDEKVARYKRSIWHGAGPRP